MTSSNASSTSAPTQPLRGLGDLLNGPLFRLLLLGLLWLLLQIPLSMIEQLVHERQQRRDEAGAEVTAKWGASQRLLGPVLRVPFDSYYVDADGKRHTLRRAAYLLPDQLKVDATLKTEERRRGIFSFPVYGASLSLHGRFVRPAMASWIGEGSQPLWHLAEVQIGLSDVRAIHADGQLSWRGQPHALQPSGGTGSEEPGVHVPLTDVFDEAGTAEFALSLHVNGSGDLFITPVGKNTTAALQADWPHPSFQGSWLPTRSRSDEQRFDADWSISYLGRNFPQQWTSDGTFKPDGLRGQVFGVTLLNTVDAYRMAERVTKYAVLAAFFTFLTVWLTELLGRRRVHPLQYILIGSALCLFGLLQLAFGEHFGFEVGFAVATAAITGMVAFYTKSVLGTWPRAGMIGGLLGGLYGYLYLLLKADDYALIGGSVALFVGLAVVMLLTRKLDWHRLGTA